MDRHAYYTNTPVEGEGFPVMSHSTRERFNHTAISFGLSSAHQRTDNMLARSEPDSLIQTGSTVSDEPQLSADTQHSEPEQKMNMLEFKQAWSQADSEKKLVRMTGMVVKHFKRSLPRLRLLNEKKTLDEKSDVEHVKDATVELQQSNKKKTRGNKNRKAGHEGYFSQNAPLLLPGRATFVSQSESYVQTAQLDTNMFQPLSERNYTHHTDLNPQSEQWGAPSQAYYVHPAGYQYDGQIRNESGINPAFSDWQRSIYQQRTQQSPSDYNIIQAGPSPQLTGNAFFEFSNDTVQDSSIGSQNHPSMAWGNEGTRIASQSYQQPIGYAPSRNVTRETTLPPFREIEKYADGGRSHNPAW